MVTLHRGDKVRIVNGERDWLVVGMGVTAVYLAAVGQPAWAPQRFAPEVVTHVFRDGTWKAISPAEGDSGCAK